MRVLVTGATGFLGSYLIDELLEAGYEVKALGRNQKRLAALKRSRDLDVAAVDLLDKEALFQAGQDCQAVIHAAALSTVWGPWKDFYEANVLASQHVLELCQQVGMERLVYVSSPSIYAGPFDQIDLKEDQAPKENRLNHYIRSKIMAEDLIRASSVPSVIIRPRGLFGIGDTSIIPRLLASNDKIGLPLVNGGNHLVDMTCVENVALALRLALESDQALGGTYNITNDEPYVFKDLLSLFFDQAGLEPHYRRLPAWLVIGLASILEGVYQCFHLKGEPAITRYTAYLLSYSQTLNIDAAKRDLAYQPKLTIEEGVKKYVRGY